MPAAAVAPLWVRLDRIAADLRSRGSESLAEDVDEAVSEVLDLERLLDRALKITEEKE